MRKLLTEMEVAETLRCSPAKVKRLRLAGQLAYLPGRPPLVREEDLNVYLESRLRQARPIEAGAPLKNFLLEAEAAERLRCTTKRIKQLREAGKLRFVPGPPVLIDETDLENYLAEELRKPHPDVDGTQEAAQDRAREQARKIWLKLQLRKRMRQNKGNG